MTSSDELISEETNHEVDFVCNPTVARTGQPMVINCDNGDTPTIYT